MRQLTLGFLGKFEATLNTEPITAFGANKVRALLAFLAIESSHPHRRAKLSAMFWPDLPEKKAAHNLSQSLLRMRQALREKKSTTAESFLVVTNLDVQFNSASDHQLDVTRFRELLNLCDEHYHAEAASCGVCTQWLLQAANLYHGDLLSGFFVPDSMAFEEWRLVWQEKLHMQMLAALERLSDYHLQRGEFERVQEFARRRIVLEPWREEAHVQLIWTLAQSGQELAALKQYETYQRILVEEMGIKPAANVTKLYEKIRSGEGVQQAVVQSDVPEAAWLSSQGEYRQVTAMVCSQCMADDSEEMSEQIEFCERTCEGIFNRFGGRRALRQGETCLIYFGYPQAYEDAARRAVHAGLAVTTNLGSEESVRIGIHTGLLKVGKQRGPRWQDRDLFGKALEIARDCQRLAGPGEVMITEGTRRLVQESFDLQALAPQSLRVTERPIQLYQVCGEGSVQSRLEWLAQTQRLTVFTGREAEMAQFRTCGDRVIQGVGQAVFLSGEMGVGKSRLIWELKTSMSIVGDSPTVKLNNQPPVLWFSSQCLPHYQNSSLYPMISLLEQLLGFQMDDNEETRQGKLAGILAWYGLKRPLAIWLLSLLLGLPTSEPAPETITKTHREQMRTLFVTLLQKRAAEQPIVLVIEDLQWSDPSTIDWLGQSIDSLADAPCLILLTARPGFNPIWLSHEDLRPNLRLLQLSPLRPEEVEQMVTNLAEEDMLDEAIHRLIVTKTDGNPLFVEELTKTLIEHSVDKGKVNRVAEISATLIDSLIARLDRLGAAKKTAQWAAVLGREFSYSVLQACTSCDEQRLQNDLARLIEAELVSPISAPPLNEHARYAFKHALMQEASYTSLLKHTRQRYHQRIAEVLETRFPKIAETQPELLAEHYTNAGMQTQAADFWLQAGERASAQGATLEATTFFDYGLERIELTDIERRWRALLGRETVLYLREEREAQKEDIEALLELAEAKNDDDWRAQAFLQQVSYALRLKDFQLMLRASEMAITAASRVGNRVLEGQALASKVTALTYMGEWHEAHQAVAETQEMLPSIEDEVVQAYILGDIAFYYCSIGDLSSALPLMQQGAEVAQGAGNRQKESRLALNMGFVNAQLGRYGEARAAFEAGLALAEAIGDQAAQTSHRYNLSYVLWCSGDREQAREMGEKALQEFKAAVNNPIGHACCLAYLGIYLEDVGEWAAAGAYLAEARTLYAGIGSLALRMEAQAVEARCMLALGDQEKARQLATDVWDYLCAREHGTEGMDFPSRVYVCVADVFTAIETPGISVREVIEAGYHELMQRANRISDLGWRQSFLEIVAENKAIVERWSKLDFNLINSIPS